MRDDTSPNGADADQPDQRPSWYVPIKPVPPDAPTAEEALLSLQVVFDPEELGDAVEDIDEFLTRKFGATDS